MTTKLDKKKFFLETTAQIGRLTGNHEKKQRIHKILKNMFDNADSAEFVITSLIVHCEFCHTLVKDVLIIQNLILNDFLKNKHFDLNLSEIDERISDSSDYNISRRAKRLFKVTSALKKRYPNSDKIETKKVYQYLDSLAKDLANKDFFNIKIGGDDRLKINKNGPNYINNIKCISDIPFQNDLNRVKKRNKISISNEIKISKCDDINLMEDCGIIEFLEEKQISEKIKKLKNESNVNKPFSPDFRKKKKNKTWIKLMRDFASKHFNDFNFKRKKCYHFFDMLMTLQCPEDAHILSNDKDFNELGRVIGRPDLLLNFDECSLIDN